MATSSMAVPSALSLAGRWILAHLGAQLISGLVSGVVGTLVVAAGGTLRSVGGLVLVLLALTYGATFGFFRGRVLRDRLPGFPMAMWCGAVTVIGLISALVVAARPALAPGLGYDTLGLLAAQALLGAALGGLAGAIEATVLRPVATNLVPWIALAALAQALSFVTISAIGAALATMRLPLLSQPALIAIGLGIGLVSALTVALITLPALRALQPRA